MYFSLTLTKHTKALLPSSVSHCPHPVKLVSTAPLHPLSVHSQGLVGSGVGSGTTGGTIRAVCGPPPGVVSGRGVVGARNGFGTMTIGSCIGCETVERGAKTRNMDKTRNRKVCSLGLGE